MKFTPNQDFLHDADRFEKDREYDLEDEQLVQYFVNNGWADAEGVNPENTLDVHDAGSDQEN